jgi:hypothetical protein
MTKSIAVPQDLYDKAAELADQEHISVDDFVSAALAEQIAARQYLSQRRARSTEDRFRQALKQIPDIEPEAYDRL